MQNLFYFWLFVIWTLFWSFGSVLIYRLKSGEKWILAWRSHCWSCKHTLWITELIPIFSWLKNFWKCKYCKQKIPAIYPLLEISTWIIFLLCSIFLVNTEKIFLWDFFEISKLFFWLSISFITILYIFYDLLFTEIHEWIMFVWIFLALIWNIFFSEIWFWIEFFSSLFLAFAILWAFYVIMLKELKEIFDILILVFIGILIFIFYQFFPEVNLEKNFILSWIIWALWIFIFFFLQIIFSWWRALGWWDLRIWIMIWLILGSNFSFLGIILAYLVWSLIWIFILIKNIKQKWVTEIPFWPFLWIWFFLTIFFNENILTFIRNYFLIM